MTIRIQIQPTDPPEPQDLFWVGGKDASSDTALLEGRSTSPECCKMQGAPVGDLVTPAFLLRVTSAEEDVLTTSHALSARLQPNLVHLQHSWETEVMSCSALAETEAQRS